MSGLFLLFILFQWSKVRELYGSNLRVALGSTARALRYNKGRRHECLRILAFFGFALLVFLSVNFVARVPLSPLVLLMCGTTTSVILSSALMPPLVLMLGNSQSDRTSLLAARLAESCQGFRPLFFLKPAGDGSHRHVQLISGTTSMGQSLWSTFAPNNYWADIPGDWRDIVFPLIDLVPILVVDLRSGSEGLSEEIALIDEKSVLRRKAIFVGDVPPNPHRALFSGSSTSTLVNPILSPSEVPAEIARRLFWRRSRSRRKSFARVALIAAMVSCLLWTTAALVRMWPTSGESVERAPSSEVEQGRAAPMARPVRKLPPTPEILRTLGGAAMLVGIALFAMGRYSIKASGRTLDDIVRQGRAMERLHWTQKMDVFHTDPASPAILAFLMGPFIAVTGLLAFGGGALWLVFR